LAFDTPLQTASLPDTRLTPFEALKRVVLPALEREPCVVSFSGGVDSSLILAAAAEKAHEEGLGAPLPVTLRFPGVPAAQEGEWQEGMIRHLGLNDWVRLSFDDELDLVGPIASRALMRHGLLWPPNAHFHVPIIEQARGGTVLTGYGGDEMLSAWPGRLVSELLCGHRPPVVRDALRIAGIYAPQWLRYVREYARVPTRPWLTSIASRALARVLARTLAEAPRGWPQWLGWRIATRRFVLTQSTLALLGADANAEFRHPLVDPLFAASLARAGSAVASGNRATMVRRIASGKLPVAIATRATKGEFSGAFWRRYSREFADRCRVTGAEEELVQLDRLRAEWRSRSPKSGTALLLQQAWLADRG
jgi:asparagine synthase (glutamine-hydrolysing)